MQSEVSPRPLLVARPCHRGKGECLALLTSFTLSPQQIRKLRRELESSQEKVATLTSQLSANVSPCGSCCSLQDTPLCVPAVRGAGAGLRPREP